MNHGILALLYIAGFVTGWVAAVSWRARRNPIESGSLKERAEMQQESREALSERTEERKEKILYLMSLDATHEKELQACGVKDIEKGITAKNVQKLLGVSGRTARKYMNELELESRIKQVGKAGRGVYYTLNA